MFPALKVSRVTKTQGEKPQAAGGSPSGLSYCSELSVGESILHINIQYQEFTSGKENGQPQRHSAGEEWWLALTVELWASFFMWCDFREEKDANYSGRACLRFRLLPQHCVTLRLDRGEKGTLESNAPRWDLMRASCTERKGICHYTVACSETHSSYRRLQEVTFPNNDLEIKFQIAVGIVRHSDIFVHYMYWLQYTR